MSVRPRLRAAVGASFLFLAVAVGPAAAQRVSLVENDDILQARLDSLVKGFHGDVGIYVRHLKSGRFAAIRADELFPTASMIKVPILATLYQQIADGKMDMHTQELMPDTAIYNYPDDLGLVGNLKPGAKVTVGELALMMITTSDNTAAIWMQALVGGGIAVNEWLAANGFEFTRVNSRTPEREAARDRYGWGQTTPREMASLLVRIREGSLVNPAASQEMYRALTRIYWNAEALSRIPPWVQAASKQGEVDRSRSEVVLVNAPSGDYVFCVITKNQVDESYQPSNEGYVLIRNLSALLWKYFEPKRPWAPAEGVEKYKP